ncbi:hypothetical protein MLD38_015564 [Melastoma candidum]|uniref:Uncharacterized protein n=1 Tax=Melastoma candidum TaxID=119954 RepID=A0ACB9RJL6_9MYRT|nr:hypothetical protein MLD38_015564 [Melastoma candidum]
MSLDGEGPVLVDHPAESRCETNKRLRICYSSEFLLSLRELDICKKLPRGFDQSILSEFEDSSHDQQRVSSAFLSHGFRRSDYGSSPPTRADSGNYSRGLHGRWDSRSSGKSHKDSDSQSDWDSDSGRRYVSQSRRGWQAPEHDGLLGSGSLPRPSSYNPGGSSYSPNRTAEPYHPPRPYKAVPYPRSSTNDSFNDETFGSSDVTTEDRAEEERKRRASFELLRKEQQRAFQELQKIGPLKGDFDITSLMEDTSNVTHSNNQSESEKQIAPHSLSTDLQKSSVPIQIPGARPLVPPGFAGTVLDKKSSSAEGKGLMPDYGSSPAATNLPLTGSAFSSKENQVDDQMSGIGADVISENSVAEGRRDNLPLTLVMLSQLGKMQSEGSAVAEPIGLDHDIVADDKVVGQLGHSNSILEKLFGNALTLDENPTILNFKPQNMMDDAQSPHAVHSSKFAHLFPEGGKGSTENLSSERSNDLLSLVIGEEKATKPEQSWPKSLFTVSHSANEQIKLDVSSKSIGSHESLHSSGKMLEVLPVLTCEDLENSILSEFSEGGPNVQQTHEVLEISDDMIKPRKNNIDDHASQHLLSLLQKGGHEDKPLSLNIAATLSDPLQNRPADNTNGLQSNSEAEIGKNPPDGGQTSTLGALFGSALMKALQSDGAPVSAQGDGSARFDPCNPNESSLPVADGKLMPPLGHDVLSSRNVDKNDITNLSQKCQSSLNMEEEFAIDDIQMEADKLQFLSKVAPGASIASQPEKVRLPEDDILVTAGDIFNLHGNLGRSSAKTEFPSYSSPFDIGGPRTALDSLLKDRNYMEQAVPPFQVPFERRDSDISFPNMQNPPSSHIQPNQFNHMGPVYNPQDSYTILNNPLMKQRESMLHVGTRPSHQLPRGMLRPTHQPSAGFDPAMLHPMMQQMHMPGSFPLSQLQGTSSGPRSSHPNRHVSGLMQELNLVPGSPFGHQPPSFGGMPPPGPEAGVANNHPEALQRLLEMELRLNNKPANPFPPAAAAAAPGHGQGLYGHDLDLSFRYR